MGLFSKEAQTPLNPAPAAQRKSVESKPHPASPSMTQIAMGSFFEGLLKGSPNVMIDGQLAGEIKTSGTVKIGSSGKVKASVRARTILVAGGVEGDLTADERIELEASARVAGNLLAPRILIKDGASLQGSVEMSAPKPSAPQENSKEARSAKSPGKAEKTKPQGLKR